MNLVTMLIKKENVYFIFALSPIFFNVSSSQFHIDNNKCICRPKRQMRLFVF